MKFVLVVLLCSFFGGYMGYAVRAFLETPYSMPAHGSRTWPWFVAHLRITAGDPVRTGVMMRMTHGRMVRVATFREYSGGVALLEWETTTPSVGLYPSVEVMRTIHGHPGTVFAFDEPGVSNGR